MINVKLKELSKRLNKTISDISRETGLNRNTITSLYHNKVDGIKFETIVKLVETYDVEIGDIIEIEKKGTDEGIEKKYKQEAAMTPFFSWPAISVLNQMPKKYFGGSFGNCSIYFKDDYAVGYWGFQKMYEMAEYLYKHHSSQKRIDALYGIYLNNAKKIEDTYFNVDQETISEMSVAEVETFLQNFWVEYGNFWKHSLFIDSFDLGLDYERIEEITQEYKLSKKEVEVLTSPSELTFNNERELGLLEIVKIVKRKKIKLAEIGSFVESEAVVAEYKKNFDFYKSDYAHVEHISNDEVEAEISKYLKNDKLFKKRYRELKSFFSVQSKKINQIIRKYKLKENPLYFFNKLTYWREHRKQVNLMGFHVLERILWAIEKETGIPIKYLKYLTFEEARIVFSGVVTMESLKKRRDEGMFVDISSSGYKVVEGKQAKSLQEEIEDRLHDKNKDKKVIFGKTASQGYAKGVAKVIMSKSDFHELKEGDILVTGMTRPEFLPIMKKAGGIVTDEGGITCHAAIVSRELGKPCIIGTKFSTKAIKSGDLIEVRANHGTVRILS